MDGSLVKLQLLGYLVARDFAAYADGYLHAKGITNRLEMVQNLCMPYLDRLNEFSADVVDLVDAFFGADQYSYVRSLYFDTGKVTHLAGVAKALSNALLAFHHGDLSTTLVVEEIHTATEIFLRAALQNAGGTFNELLEAALRKGLFDAQVKEALFRLKEHRKQAKHRGRGITYDSVREVMPEALRACQLLAAHIRAHAEG